MNKHPLGAHGFNIFAFASQSKHGHNGATKSPRSNLKRRFFGCGQCVYDGCSGEVTDKSPGKRSQQSKFKCMLNTGRVQNLHIPWPGHRLARRPHDFPFRRPNCQRKILDVAADECPTSGRILDSPTIRTLAPSSKSSRTCLACKGFTGTTRRRCTRQHPGTKSAPRPADKNADKPVTNSGFCPPSVYLGFPWFVLPGSLPGRHSSIVWGMRLSPGRIVTSASCAVRPRPAPCG